MANENRLIYAHDLWTDIMMLPHNGDMISSEEVEQAIKDAPTVDAVEVPCKIGDFVWAIRSFKGHKHPQRGIVSDMFFTRNMKLQIVVKYVARGEWGKTVFATDKDAYAAIGVSPCPNCGAKMDGERKDNG